MRLTSYVGDVGACCRYALDQLQDTEKFQQQIREEVNSRSEYNSVSLGSVLRGYVYHRRVTHSGTQVDYRQKLLPFGALGPEEIILDHGQLAKTNDGYAAITGLNISVDSRFAVYTVDLTGAERYQAHVLDLASENSSNPIEILEDVWSVEWAGDSNELLYTRPDDLRRPATLFHHAPMTNQGKDRLLFEEEDDEFFLDVSRTKDDAFIMINSNSKTSQFDNIPAENLLGGSDGVLRSSWKGNPSATSRCSSLLPLLTRAF